MIVTSDCCCGKITWERNQQKSTIDYVAINEEIIIKIKEMKIDENKELYDLSDHNMIEIILELECDKKQKRIGNKNTDIKYISYKKEDLIIFVEEFEIENKNISRISCLNEHIKKLSEKILSRNFFKNKKGKDRPWFNKEIDKEIGIRKSYNRKKRNYLNMKEKNKYLNLYNEQKILVQRMVKQSKIKYEKEMTDKIKSNKDNKKEQWKYINKLRGKDPSRTELQIFGKYGEILDKEEEKEELTTVWKQIYQQHDNNIKEEWEKTKSSLSFPNNTIRLQYQDEWNIDRNTGIISAKTNTVTIHNNLAEHYSAVFKIDRQPVNCMKSIKFTEKEIYNQVKKTKDNKACGPDGLKNELYKAIVEDKTCLKTLTECFNTEITSETKPESWKKSITIMLPKDKKPNAMQLRPIALTDCSYKILMSLIKKRVEEHLENNALLNEMQAGFTKSRRVEDNIIILYECKEEAYRRKKQLIVISIDYKKAYDSLNRNEIVKVLNFYKVEKYIINFIVQIYDEDTTYMKIRDDLKIFFEINNGIRQGCTLSATIFKMITYKIMDAIERNCAGVKIGDLKINSLFYADDGLILAHDKIEAEKNLNIVREVSKKYGLEINYEKSKVIVYNRKEDFENIGGIEVGNELKYLGVTITDKRNMFNKYSENQLIKGKKLENLTFSMIESSCNRVLIGKAFWKNICVPALIHAFNAIKMKEEFINKLQVIENSVYRKILKAASFTPVGTLRGDIGSSLMKTRIIKGKIIYWKSIMEGNNELLKEIIKNPKCFLNI